jgi:D-alanyl-lipoteichoic acid acyltransferase DltB (MBOAT superfamily)
MFLSNLGKIISKNCASLVEEAGGESRFPKLYVIFFFAFLPILVGVLLGYYIELWAGFISTLISVVGILTGFSINSVVLLSGHDANGVYEQRKDAVRQTKDFTLYSILIGIVLLSALTLGYLMLQVGSDSPISFSNTPIAPLTVASISVYAILAHYLLILFFVTHRLYTMVHIDVVG